MTAPARPDRPATPTLKALSARGTERRHLNQFLEWLEEQGLEICRLGGDAITERHEQLVLRYLNLDPKLIEAERRALLDWQTELNER